MMKKSECMYTSVSQSPVLLLLSLYNLKNEELRDRYQERRSSSFEITYNYGSG